MNHYEILGVKEDASPEEIKSAYRELARKWHPDKAHLLVGEDKSQNGTEKMAAINNAYEILYDPDKRNQYDISLASAANASTSSASSSTSTDNDKALFYTQLEALVSDLAATTFRTDNLGSNTLKKAQSDFAFIKASYGKLSQQLTDNDKYKIFDLIQQKYKAGVSEMPQNEGRHIAEMGAKAFLSLLNGEQALSDASLSKASIKILSKSHSRDPLVDMLQSYATIQASNNHDEKNVLLHQLMIHLAKNHEQSDLLEKTVNSIMVKAKKPEKVDFIREMQTDLAAYKASIGINPPAASAAATPTTNENQKSTREDPYKKRAQKYDTKAMRNPSKGTGYSSEALRPNKSSNEDEKKEKSNIFRRMFK